MMAKKNARVDGTTDNMKEVRNPKDANRCGSARTPAKSKSQLQDDSIMGTNNSSIVSKRSVERLYFPNEPHFFRYFVKKPQRRSPLINRGYWLRMKAIDHVVKQFLEQKSEKKKIVVNLGCGYDPLPWQCFTRYADSCHRTTFVDIDYRDLMLKKRVVVQGTPELNSMLSNVEVSEDDVLLRSEQYIQLGCDLRDLTALHKVLASVVDIENCLVLFTAEVSITYMNLKAADALIEWASRLPEARFCLLEQLLPDGIDHPFAKTMMAHFDKLQTPLHAVQRYPTALAQEQRFKGLGWSKVAVRNLWELWGSSDFLSPIERKSLDRVEPFDEWEEFALFGQHYFCLVADTGISISPTSITIENESEHMNSSTYPTTEVMLSVSFAEYPKSQGRRRFAAAMPLTGPVRSLTRFGTFGGMGLVSRMGSYDEYASDKLEFLRRKATAITPSSRMCHTITDIGDAGALLVGGRTSPDNGLKDCWLYHKWLNVWERVDDLPQPLYRHRALRIGLDHVLVSTGRIDSQTISSDFLIWSRQNGWVKCELGAGDIPRPSYGSVFFPTDGEVSKDDLKTSKHGILSGGMTGDAELQQETWRWELRGFESESPTITFVKESVTGYASLLPRFGAEAVKWNGQILVLGGILKRQILSSDEEICLLSIQQSSTQVSRVHLESSGAQVPRPLLIGSTAVATDDKLVITGGSCVCFSFGSWWNGGCFTLSSHTPSTSNTTETPELADPAWHYLHTVDAEPHTKFPASTVYNPPSLLSIPRKRIASPTDFMQIINSAKPIILENLDIGECTSKWTSEYLQEHIGQDREVIVHEAKTDSMDFMAKNFSYISKKFGDFLNSINSGERLYLRSLSSQNPIELPTNLATDFPSIASDFRLPPELVFVTENSHSSPLRISGPVNMWLHYDVMANVLCQIRGSKRMLLFPPTDASQLEFEPGSSSSSINAFERLKDGTVGNTHPHEALLQPGDVLFLPPLWLHAASPTSTVSISVNVFFKNLTNVYASGKDTYGNRDLKAYEKGRMDIAKIIKSFDGLPSDMRSFYLQRLADEFVQKVS